MKHVLKNIKTTIFGAFAGLPVLVEGIAHKDFIKIITGASIFLTGLFAADSTSIEK
jgi:uncharacterized membrane protein